MIPVTTGPQVVVPAEPRFLTAEWRNLAMLNYEIDPSVLKERVPAGCELDCWFGRAFVSLVGFQFLRTRVLGIAIPFHRNFEEVNLRFYVRRKAERTCRRGNWEGMSISVSGLPSTPSDDTEEIFITEHYWGYSRQRDRATVEYQVEHPRWRVWRAATAALSCDASSLYGPEFVEALAGTPSTAFVADGSPIVVRRGRRLM